MNSPKKIRFGIIGCSRVALKGMLPALVDSNLVELAMIGSRSEGKAREIALQFNCKKFGSYEDVLIDKDIDAVYVSLPNAMHEEWAIKAANSGKHVLCEKPAAISYDAAKKMVDAAKKNNVRMLEGFMFRYHPQHSKVREFIENGTLGELLKIEGCFGYAMPDKKSNALSKKLGGGSFNDQVPYPVYTSRMLFGEEPESVRCTIYYDSEYEVSVKTDIMLNYSEGKTAFATSIFGSYFQSMYSVLGTKASIRTARAYAVPRDMNTKIFLEADDKIQELIIEPADHFRLMVDEFCEEISKGKESKKNYETDLLAQAKVLEAARMSNDQKRVVRLAELDSDNQTSLKKSHQIQKVDYQKIILTGGSGNLGRSIVRSGIFPNILAPSHSELDVTNKNAIADYFKKNNPDAVIHSAAIVKMSESENEIWKQQAIETNIVGTCNLIREILKLNKEGKNIRLIYISTDGVYPGVTGGYSETDATIPYNNYGWTKLGGEAAVHLLSNFCILRTSFFDPDHIPFDTSATDMYASKMPLNLVSEAIKTVLFSDFVGTVNVGDKRKSYYERYKEFKPSLNPSTFEDVARGVLINVAKDSSLDLSLWEKIKGDLK